MINELPLANLHPSKLQPRQHFDDASSAELTASIRQHGVLTNLIVRPDWCIGTITVADLEARRVEAAPGWKLGEKGGNYDIVSGERRYRAAMALVTGDNLAPQDYMMPVRVKPMTDPEVLAINLTEQMQRNELTPLEEADGFFQLLAYKDENGAALHTPVSLGRTVGKSPDYVLARLTLRKLPASGKRALAAGEIHPSAAARVARVPDSAMREEACALMLKGGRDGAPMTYTETVNMLAEKFMVQLKGAPFDPEAAELCADVAAGAPGYGVWSGKCSDCPHRSGNLPDFVKTRAARTDLCTNTACYRAKCQASFAIQAAKATEQGVKVLDDKASAKLFEITRTTEIRFNCDWVELDTRPAPHLLKNEVKNAPMWRELADRAAKAGMTPERILAKDGAGRARWLVNSATLIAASEKLGEPIFAGQKGADDVPPVERKAGEDNDDAFARGKREHAEKQRQEAASRSEEGRLRELVVAAQIRAVHAGLGKSWIKAPIWEEMLRLFALGALPIQWVLHRLLATKETDPVKLAKLIAKQPEIQRQALVPLLPAAEQLHALACGRVAHSPALSCFAQLAGVDLVAIAVASRKETEAPKNKPTKPKPKPKPSPAKTAVSAVKGSLKKPVAGKKRGAK
jgi:ParB/RepB/Spo0J family partition protein